MQGRQGVQTSLTSPDAECPCERARQRMADGQLSNPTHPTPQTRDDRLDRLRLVRSRRVGAVTYHRLMAEHGTAKAALEALPGIAKAAGVEEYEVCPLGRRPGRAEEGPGPWRAASGAWRARLSPVIGRNPGRAPGPLGRGDVTLLNLPPSAWSAPATPRHWRPHGAAAGAGLSEAGSP